MNFAFKTRQSTAFGILGLSVLTACGGSGSDVGAEAQSIVAQSSDEVFALGTELGEQYIDDIADSNFLERADLPVTGSADYEGVIGIGPSDVGTDPTAVSSIVGQLNVNVDFAANDIDGIAGNFFVNSSDATEVGGSLDMDASIDATTGLFEGDLTGTLINVNRADGEGGIPVDITISGGFSGDDAEAFLGTGSGTVLFPDDDTTTPQGAVFAAELR